ncbi:MAG: glycosyltransferase family 4 protein, partial [Bacteroidia bacterium]|nr:glycosyltransferase family 4 protein [Bacteroidia bacterium]
AVYFNAPIFKQRLNWLHFGFGTLGIGRENLAQSINSKMAVSFRGFDIGVYPVRHPHCYELLWKRVNKVHVISDDLAELIRKEGFKDQAPVVKITPAIDTSFFKASGFNEIKQPLKITTVARLHWKKGLDYTLKALAALRDKGIKFQYSIIGSGIEYEHLKFSSVQLGLDEEVIFHGELPHEELKKIMSDSMLYLQYSVQEGFCNAVLEAQAMGLLCIVSDAEGLSENVQHAKTGWVVPKRQPDKLTEQIIEVLNTAVEMQKSISYNASKRVVKEFDIRDQTEAFIRFYE